MADATLPIIIKEAYIPRAVEAFTGLAGKRIDIMVHGDDFNANWDFIIEPKGDTESAVEYGQRFFREVGKAFLKLWDYQQDQLRYDTEVRALTRPAQDVPDDILT